MTVGTESFILTYYGDAGSTGNASYYHSEDSLSEYSNTFHGFI
jgi:hypothetical protein